MKQESTLPLTVKNLATLPLASGDASWTLSKAYHELDEVPVREIDLIESVEENVHRLEDLQARLRFMMREVKYLLKL